MKMTPTWEGGRSISDREGQKEWNFRKEALNARGMGENSKIQTWRWLPPQCEAWGLVLHHLLPGAGITRGSWKPCRFQKERQVDTNQMQGIRLNKGYRKRTVHSRPHTCSSIPILFPNERRQHAPSIAGPKPESSCFFLSPHTSIESPNSDTIHSSQTTPPFIPSSRALVSACRTALLKSFFGMAIGVTKPDCKISLYRLPYRETSAAHGPRAQLEHSKLSATLPQLQGSSSDTPDYFAVAPSNPSHLMPPALAQADCSLNNSRGDLEVWLSGRALVFHAQGITSSENIPKASHWTKCPCPCSQSPSGTIQKRKSASQ